MIPERAPWPDPVTPSTVPETMHVERQTLPPDPLMFANSAVLSSPPPRCAGRNRLSGPSECEWAEPPTVLSGDTALAVTASGPRRCNDPRCLQRLPIELHVHFVHASAA